MCGIFAYLNYLTPKTRKEIVDILINGLKRLEYRGYDSAGNHLESFFKSKKNRQNRCDDVTISRFFTRVF